MIEFPRIMASLRSSKLLPWLLLAAGLAATSLLQQAASNAERQIKQDSFAYQAHEITLRVEQRLATYEEVLRGVEGLYIASKEVDREEFRNYVTNLRLASNYPGIQAVGFSLIIPPHEKARHIEAIRREGFPGYTLHPEGERNLYTSSIFLEPFTGRNPRAFGYDMYSEAVRRVAMERARDLDNSALSGKVTLVQEAGKDVQAGFLMYVPAYRNGSPHETLAERRANIIGWVYAAFRMNDLMHGILGEQVSNIDLHIFDGEYATLETLMYDTDADFSRSLTNPSLYQSSRRITVSGHTWTIELGSLPDFEANLDTGRVTSIRLTGILMSVLLALLVWQLASGRARALKLAQDMTRQLRESEARLALTLAAAELGTWDWNVKTGHIIFNERWAGMRGYRQEEFEPNFSSWESGIYPEDLLLVQKKLAEHFAGNSAIFNAEYRFRTQSGPWIWIMARGTVIERDAEGNPLRVVGIEVDITERKQADAKLRIASVAFESQESLMITDANGVILQINRAFTESTGYTSEEAIGKNPRILRSGRHNADFYRSMWETLHRTGAWQGEIWDRRKDGGVYPKWLSITAVKGADGAVTHYVGSHIDITERKAAEDEIRSLAFYDPLTHLPNRRLLMDRLKQALASSTRSGKKGALLFLDLDNFKTLNDTLGHDIGDLLLQQVAKRLESCVREGDTVARLGGDEFVVLLENLSEQALEAAAQTRTIGEKILTTLNQPYQLATHEYRSTPSIGATLFNNHERDMGELLRQADIAMYQAKKAGRNAMSFFDPQIH